MKNKWAMDLGLLPGTSWSCGGAAFRQPKAPPKQQLCQGSKMMEPKTAHNCHAIAPYCTCIFQKSNQVPFGLRNIQKH